VKPRWSVIPRMKLISMPIFPLPQSWDGLGKGFDGSYICWFCFWHLSHLPDDFSTLGQNSVILKKLEHMVSKSRFAQELFMPRLLMLNEIFIQSLRLPSLSQTLEMSRWESDCRFQRDMEGPVLELRGHSMICEQWDLSFTWSAMRSSELSAIARGIHEWNPRFLSEAHEACSDEPYPFRTHLNVLGQILCVSDRMHTYHFTDSASKLDNM
jgi:hypothetical protein